jgi:hypothetical protein
VQGTRGGMLALAGQDEEAAGLLKSCIEQTKSRADKTISAAVLAWIEHRRGNATEAARWTVLARQENAGKYPVEWMAAEMNVPVALTANAPA